MVKKTGIILLLVLAAQYAGRPQGAAPTGLPGLAFAQLQEDGQPCPPECITDSMEIVTWYPSPYNEYEELRLYPKYSADESQCNSSEQLGLIYYNKDEQALKVCWQDPGDFSYSWEKIGSEQSGLLRLGNYLTSSRPSCGNTILGALVYDMTEKRPYVCALNASNNPVWKPLDSDYDRDGVTDAVDANDNDFNDATAVEVNVETGMTFYARGGSRRTGTLAVEEVQNFCSVGYCSGSGCGGTSTWGNCSKFGSKAICTGSGYTKYNQCSCAPGYTLTIWVEGPDCGGCGYIFKPQVYYCKKNTS